MHLYIRFWNQIIRFFQKYQACKVSEWLGVCIKLNGTCTTRASYWNVMGIVTKYWTNLNGTYLTTCPSLTLTLLRGRVKVGGCFGTIFVRSIRISSAARGASCGMVSMARARAMWTLDSERPSGSMYTLCRDICVCWRFMSAVARRTSSSLMLAAFSWVAARNKIH